MTTKTYDQKLGWVTAIPEPFWVRRFFRWKLACYSCKITFVSRDQYTNHWLKEHQ